MDTTAAKSPRLRGSLTTTPLQCGDPTSRSFRDAGPCARKERRSLAHVRRGAPSRSVRRRVMATVRLHVYECLGAGLIEEDVFLVMAV